MREENKNSQFKYDPCNEFIITSATYVRLHLPVETFTRHGIIEIRCSALIILMQVLSAVSVFYFVFLNRFIDFVILTAGTIGIYVTTYNSALFSVLTIKFNNQKLKKKKKKQFKGSSIYLG